MKNKLSDLNNHLFAQLERLGEENLTPEKLAQIAFMSTQENVHGRHNAEQEA